MESSAKLRSWSWAVWDPHSICTCSVSHQCYIKITPYVVSVDGHHGRAWRNTKCATVIMDLNCAGLWMCCTMWQHGLIIMDGAIVLLGIGGLWKRKWSGQRVVIASMSPFHGCVFWFKSVPTVLVRVGGWVGSTEKPNATKEIILETNRLFVVFARMQNWMKLIVKSSWSYMSNMWMCVWIRVCACVCVCEYVCVLQPFCAIVVPPRISMSTKNPYWRNTFCVSCLSFLWVQSCTSVGVFVKCCRCGSIWARCQWRVDMNVAIACSRTQHQSAHNLAPSIFA